MQRRSATNAANFQLYGRVRASERSVNVYFRRTAGSEEGGGGDGRMSDKANPGSENRSALFRKRIERNASIFSFGGETGWRARPISARSTLSGETWAR